MTESFISQPIKPMPGTFDAGCMAIGEPSLPAEFIWKETLYTVADVLDKWKETRQCQRSTEQYVSKHWFLCTTTTGETMKIYFERQLRSKNDLKKRWWLYSLQR